MSVSEKAQGSAAEEHVHAKLLFDKDLKRVGVLFSIIPDWHIYWRNAGESGLETKLNFNGLEADEIRFETPSIYVDPSGTINTFGFSTETLVWADVKSLGNEPEVRVKINFLTCKVSCIPGSLELVRKKIEIASSEEIAVFEKYTKRAPHRIDLPVQVSEQTIERNSATELTVDLTCDCAPLPRENKNYYFIPDRLGVAQWKTIDIKKKDTGLRLKLSGQTYPDKTDFCSLRGVLPILDKDGSKSSLWIDTPLKCSDDFRAAVGGETKNLEASNTKNETKEEGSFLWFLLLAFVGGMILNLMPCVFPLAP